MNSNICNFCQKTFSCKSSLKYHEKNSVACLTLRNENIQKVNCSFCNKDFATIYNLETHYKRCKELNINSLITKYKSEQKELNEKYDKLLSDYNRIKEENIKYKEDEKLNNYIKVLYEEEKTKNSNLENEINKLASKAIENAGNKTITTKNKVINNLLPLTNQYLKEQSQLLQLKHIVNGAESLAYFAKEHSLKDRVICTDVARRNFIFKDENENIIKDPKGVKITKKFIENNKEELCRLLKEYALMYYDDNCPYEYKDKVEIDECLYAVQNGDVPSNAENYIKFERQFTGCFSKLVYSKQFEECKEEDDGSERNYSE